MVLFSGGQDSTTCLAWALARYARVETVAFDYGQRHAVELDCRLQVLAQIKQQFPAWAHKLGQDHLLPIPVLGAISETSLTREKAIEIESSGLPNAFVPGRNLLFLTLAAALAYRRDLRHLVTGVCETDYSGYPDCRPEYIAAFETMANLATKAGVEGHKLSIHAPLIDLSKTEIIRAGAALGVDYSLTVSCYQADNDGRACGVCDSCRLRAEGFSAAGLPDPTVYQS